VPDFIDPVLSYLESVLPASVYSALLTGSSHILAITTALLSSLSSSPSTWTAQAIIPPLITLLSAYLALSSIYRTIRLTLWFAKWGTILAALMGGIGWLAAGGASDLVATGSGKTQKSSSSRPKAWESWTRHNEYEKQRQGRTKPQAEADDVQRFVHELAGAAGRMYAQSGDWWTTAKGVVDEIGKQGRAGWEEAMKNPDRKSRSKTGKTAGTR